MTLGLVIALLALLLPALSGVRRSARSVACASNLRQYGAALEAYQAEHPRWIPFAEHPFDLGLGWVAPVDTLARLLDVPCPRIEAELRVVAHPVFLCPDDAGHGPRAGWSYAYLAQEFIAIAGYQEAVQSYRTRPTALPLISDRLPFHANAGRNELYYDGPIRSSEAAPAH